MATQGVNTNAQRVKLRDDSDAISLGTFTDIWDQTSQVLTSLTVPVGFVPTVLNFQGTHAIQKVVAGSNVTVDFIGDAGPPVLQPVASDNRYLQDLNNPFGNILDEAGIQVSQTVAAGNTYGLDDILGELSAFRYLRIRADTPQTGGDSYLIVHSKEP